MTDFRERMVAEIRDIMTMSPEEYGNDRLVPECKVTHYSRELKGRGTDFDVTNMEYEYDYDFLAGMYDSGPTVRLYCDLIWPNGDHKRMDFNFYAWNFTDWVNEQFGDRR